MPIERLTPRSIPRPWGREEWVVHTADYSGKLLYYTAGQCGGLQYHVLKDETFMVLSGRCILRYDDGGGYLSSVELGPGDAVRFPPFAVHQIEAITDVTGIEWSTPHEDDRVRVEERYGVPVAEGSGETTWEIDWRGQHVRRVVE